MDAMTNKIAINSVIKLIKQTGSNVWDYTTLKICYPNKHQWIVVLLRYIGIQFERNHIISLNILYCHKENLLRR